METKEKMRMGLSYFSILSGCYGPVCSVLISDSLDQCLTLATKFIFLFKLGFFRQTNFRLLTFLSRVFLQRFEYLRVTYKGREIGE